MGLGDRDYMRVSQGPRGRGLTSWVVRLIVIICAASFVQWVLARYFGADVVSWFGVSWNSVLHGKLWTPLTHALLHVDGRHLLWNMIGLYFFGRMVESSLPGRAYVRFAIVAAVAGGLGHLIGGVLTGGLSTAVGASGIVSACLAFAALRHPRVGVRLIFLPFFAIPLWLIAVLWFGIDVWGALGGGGGVAYWGHLGGAAYGALAHLRGGVPAWPSVRLRRGPRKAPPAAREAPRDPERPDERARVDHLLEKISREGISALSDAERDFLRDASKRY